jgi:deferrochelatase/peroxidase EfeB
MSADAMPGQMPLPAAREIPGKLELADIQGNILTAYGRLGFPKARYLLLNIRDASAGRAAIEFIRPLVTTALRWPSTRSQIPTGAVVVERPKVTLNLAFTFRGLLALGVPTRTLRGMPDDFIDGMAARAAILGDDVPGNDRAAWDPVWQVADEAHRPHVLVMLNAQMQPDGTAVPELDAVTQRVVDYCRQSNGKIVLLSGHRGASADWQELSALLEPAGGGTVQPTPREHFGFMDAISDPVFQGQFPDHAAESRATGNGKSDGHGRWLPLATGEFLLGWADEAQEVPGAAMPLDFSRNGTFIAYRKLHQEVAAFDDWIERTARDLMQVWRIDDLEQARETLKAKMAGRWSDGVPVMAAPDFTAWKTFNQFYPANGTPEQQRQRAERLINISYRDDPQGLRCPITAHTRRSNTRDMLDPLGSNPDLAMRQGSALNNRRRILRRGLPYGAKDASDGEHGIVMLVVCASLARQFEFVQQQWINYGLDFGAGNDTCPLVGNHGKDAKFVIPADPASQNPPFIATDLPQLVSVRGGDYFFIPSMTALRMIGMGVVDPT